MDHMNDIRYVTVCPLRYVTVCPLRLAAHRVDWVLEIAHASLPLDVLQLVLIHACGPISSWATELGVLCRV